MRPTQSVNRLVEPRSLWNLRTEAGDPAYPCPPSNPWFQLPFPEGASRHCRCLGIERGAMSSSPWEPAWEGNEDVAAPFDAGSCTDAPSFRSKSDHPKV